MILGAGKIFCETCNKIFNRSKESWMAHLKGTHRKLFDTLMEAARKRKKEVLVDKRIADANSATHEEERTTGRPVSFCLQQGQGDERERNVIIDDLYRLTVHHKFYWLFSVRTVVITSGEQVIDRYKLILPLLRLILCLVPPRMAEKVFLESTWRFCSRVVSHISDLFFGYVNSVLLDCWTPWSSYY